MYLLRLCKLHPLLFQAVASFGFMSMALSHAFIASPYFAILIKQFALSIHAFGSSGSNFITMSYISSAFLYRSISLKSFALFRYHSLGLDKGTSVVTFVNSLCIDKFIFMPDWSSFSLGFPSCMLKDNFRVKSYLSSKSIPWILSNPHFRLFLLTYLWKQGIIAFLSLCACKTSFSTLRLFKAAGVTIITKTSHFEILESMA